jgi:hypothetical protein
MQPFKLLLEKPVHEDIEVIYEEVSPSSPRTVYVQGPYLMASKPNLNHRIYDLNEMVAEVARYKKEFIDTNRSTGELNHPESSTEVDLSRACHLVTKLEQKGDYFMGKSKILSTPSGTIVKSLLSDGVKLGISSRALGRLAPEGENNRVSGLRILAMDIVHTPSVNDAMMESIMESRSFLISEGGQIVELACDSLECRLNSLPKKDVEVYMTEGVITPNEPF